MKQTRILHASLCLSIFCFSVRAVFGSPECAPPPSGLVGWWKADGSTVDVLSGNVGTAFNLSYAPGEVGQAFNFNGMDSYVEVSNSASLVLPNELTIEFWVKRQQPFGPDYIINKGGDWTGGALNYGVAIAPPQYNNILHFTFAGGNRGTIPIADLNWHHCAVVARNGDVDPIFYVDGVQQAVTHREGAAVMNLYPSTRNLYVGAQVDPATGWFYYSKTSIDELGVYSRTLSASEIQAIYAACSAGKCPPAVIPDCTPPPSGLVHWWQAESNALDAVSGNSGVLMNSADFLPGEVGSAFKLNGVNQYVLVQMTNSALNAGTGSGFTMEGWIQPTTISKIMLIAEYERALGTYDGNDVGAQFGANVYPGVGLSTGCLGANIKDVSGGDHIFATAPNLLTAAVWQHIALSYSQASGVATIYLNGTQVAQVNLGSFVPQTSFTNLLIGGRTTFNSPSSPSDCFSGGLDEMSVYNIALSASEIKAIYDAGSAGKCFEESLNHPPTADASATALLVISPNGTNANVVLNGSRSSDPDGDALQYFWFQPGVSEPFATGGIAVTVLPLGINPITLKVTDGFASNEQDIQVEVITISEAIQRLINLVNSNAPKAKSLAATLSAAIRSVDRSNPISAINQLRAFQNQVLTQITPLDSALADTLIKAAQEIIDTLSSGNFEKPRAKIRGLARQAGGKMKMEFTADAAGTQIIETSTDLVHWVKIGVGVNHGDGTFHYEDDPAMDQRAHFYRVVSP